MIQRLKRAVDARLSQRRHTASVREVAGRLFPERRVRTGPFAGLRYPNWQGHGSAVFAKLLGTYEAELHAFVESVLADQPNLVVDVGCAEGFYAVGCAMRLPQAEVIAADLSPAAQSLCAALARHNGVAERVRVMGRVDRQTLLDIARRPHGFLISDCEAGEAELLDPETLTALSSWFLLVEMHEFLVPGLEEKLIAAARLTHEIEVVDSVDDFRRQSKWPHADVLELPPALRLEIYHEGRPGLMRWLCARPLKT